MIAINFYGHFDGTAGISEAARLNAKALAKVGVKLNIFSYDFGNNYISNSPHNTNNYKSSINLIQINYDRAKDFIKKEKRIFNNSENYNIACWAWEFPETTEEMKSCLSKFDELWVPSSFCVNVFSQISTSPVLCFPHPIESAVTSKYNRDHFNIQKNDFVFLNIFDSYSSLIRKNPLGVIRAFKKASKDTNRQIRLIVKSMNLNKFGNEFNEIKEAIASSDNIDLIDKRLEKEELTSLINNSDCLISLHRSEGFGLTMAEAMSYGKPVIATGYSGNLEFMNVNNSMLVKSKTSKTTESHGSILKGYTFCEPDVEHANELIKLVFTNLEMNKIIGQRAKDDITQQLSLQCIGTKMKDRIALIDNERVKKEKNYKYNNLFKWLK